MKYPNRFSFVVLLFALVAIGVTSAVAQNQLNLNDGTDNSFFFGGGSNHISLTMPTMNCGGGSCYLANATANGTGELASNGNYSITAPATTPVMGGFAGPFYLTVEPSGTSIVTQTAPITFNYNSTAGTLTGLITFTSASPTTGGISTLLGTLQVTGGTFAQFFPNGGNITISMGVILPLQIFPITAHAFSAMEFQHGTIVPAAACGTLQRLKRYEEGLPRIAPRGFNDLNASFSQTNNPSQIPCTATSPCGSIDVALGTGSFDGDLVVTVGLSGPGTDFQFDRMGFNSDLNSGFSLTCFAFGSNCASGVGGATLGGAKQEDGFGSFANTLYTGLNGGSGCSSDGTGCQNLFTFVIANSNGPLQLSDFDTYVAGHIANGSCSGYIATPTD